MTARFVVLASLMFTGGCATDTVSIDFQAVTGSSTAGPGAIVRDEAGTSFTLTSAQVHLRDIELDVPDGSSCDDVAAAGCVADTIKIQGPFVIDLLTGVSDPPLEDVSIPAGTYKRIDFRIDDGQPSQGLVGAGDPLDNRSMVATASFLYESQPVTLSLSLRFNEDVRVEDPAGIDVSGDAAALLTTFDAGVWLDGLDIVECLRRGDLAIVGGAVTVDDDTTAGSGACSEIETLLKHNIKTAAQFDRSGG